MKMFMSVVLILIIFAAGVYTVFIYTNWGQGDTGISRDDQGNESKLTANRYSSKIRLTGKQTVKSVLAFYGKDARARIKPFFKKTGIEYPPEKITLLGLKDIAVLELWGETRQGPRFIRTYGIQALSGMAGPKLREGDKQVPEGIYQLEYLNPNSSYHLSMKINYPNAFDRKYASKEGRKQPGTNIFIHGKAVSEGCLAMGDEAIEELFVLVADIGVNNVKVMIAPTDPRLKALSLDQDKAWVGKLYAELNQAFAAYVEN